MGERERERAKKGIKYIVKSYKIICDKEFSQQFL